MHRSCHARKQIAATSEPQADETRIAGDNVRVRYAQSRSDVQNRHSPEAASSLSHKWDVGTGRPL
jgi:hypothetical protein